eukprot:6113808-Alexandrium_andersonii.AAC.1
MGYSSTPIDPSEKRLRRTRQHCSSSPSESACKATPTPPGRGKECVKLTHASVSHSTLGRLEQ